MELFDDLHDVKTMVKEISKKEKALAAQAKLKESNKNFVMAALRSLNQTRKAAVEETDDKLTNARQLAAIRGDFILKKGFQKKKSRVIVGLDLQGEDAYGISEDGPLASEIRAAKYGRKDSQASRRSSMVSFMDDDDASAGSRSVGFG